MQRLFRLFWLALSLALVSGQASAARSDCPMAEAKQVHGHYDAMGCCDLACAQECSAVCPAAMMPSPSGVTTSSELVDKPLAAGPAEALVSAELTRVDRPPRTTFS
jgi:hypothetical protein